MKFWKMVLAVVVGLLIVWLLAFMLIGSFAGAVAAAGGSRTVLPRSGVLAVDMSAFNLGEQSSPKDAMTILQGGTSVPTVGIYKAVEALKAAAKDPGVKFIFLKTDGALASSAAIEEFRQALSDFRKSGKPVISYFENPTTGTYYLASVADKMYMSSYQGSTISMAGVSARSLFLKDLLDKLGVNVQLIRHGKYKSAGEMFVRNSSSAENTEQYQALVNSMWNTLSAPICESRDISREDLDALFDGLKLCLPEDFLQLSMVDGLMTRQELKDKLADLAVAGSFEKVKFIPFADYAAAKVLPNTKSKEKIAILYMDGEIVDGKGLRNISGDRFTSVIDKVRADSSIKAVVLRVNSPGGSVVASEKIKHELDLLGKEKPLIASYGDYAASGGYWISNNCDKIYSDAMTLTGSIGVFGMVPDFSKTAKNLLHVGVETVKSHKHADMMGLTRPFDADEYNYMLRSIETIYDKFTDIVADGRGLAKEKVDEIGQGRVWTGADALGIGLVDEIGTLEDALDYAAVAAGNADRGKWQIAEYPAPLTPFEEFVGMMGSSEEQQYVKAMSKVQVLARMPWQLFIY